MKYLATDCKERRNILIDKDGTENDTKGVDILPQALASFEPDHGPFHTIYGLEGNQTPYITAVMYNTEPASVMHAATVLHPFYDIVSLSGATILARRKADFPNHVNPCPAKEEPADADLSTTA